MNPVYWLLIVIVCGMALILAAALIAYPVGYDRGYEDAVGPERHTHRKGDPLPAGLVELPLSGRLAVEPDPDDWRFAGSWDQGPVAERAEHELLAQTADHGDFTGVGSNVIWHPAQTAELPVSVTGEPPIDTGELLAITARVDAWIAGIQAQGNYDRHTMRAD